MIIQACLNGSRPADYHPRLPVTVGALAADAAEVVAAGAAEIHLHIRGADGSETLSPAAVDQTLSAVRSRVPGTLVGVSTGAWIEGDDEARLTAIAGWTLLPDHASVNLSEPGAPAVIEMLHRRGVAIELGLGGVADAERLVRLGLAHLGLRVLIEMDAQTSVDDAMAAADGVLEVLRSADIRKPVLLHGFDDTVWPLAQRGLSDGYSIRVGLEDGRTLPDGTPAASNAALVAAAIEMRVHQMSRG